MPIHIIVKDIRTMDMTIDQQVALDEAFVPHASRLRIGKSNFCLRSDITSKELTLQLATATVHHHSIRFKMNNMKRIVNLEYFREMLHISPRLPNQTFDELPFEEEILAFLRYLRHNEEIKKLTNVNINKLHQPWRSFAAVINKCLTYKEYYAIASGVAPPKTKASVRKTQSSFDTTMPPPTATSTRLSTLAKGKQPAKSSKAKGLYKSSDEDDDDEVDDRSDDQEDKDDQEDDDDDDQEDDDDQDDNDQDDNDDDQDTDNDGAVSSIPKIVERYIDQQINEAVKVAVQIQFDRLRDEAQAKNEEFLNNLDENIHKILKEQVKEQVKVQVYKILPKIKKTVNGQLEAKFLTRSSNSSKTSYAVAVDLSEMELKKILIEKMESNKHRDDADKDEEPSVGSDRGSKRRREGKGPESTSAPKEKATKTSGKSTQGFKSHQNTASESAPAEEPMQKTQDLEEPSHQEFETGAADDQPITEASQHHEWFRKQKKPPTPDHAWNKTLPATHESIQPWIHDLAKQADSRSSFNELMDTPVDFSVSLVELEFFLEEVYKATTDQLDRNNPKGQQYPHNLLKPLPLIPNSRGRCVIPFDYFINNDLEYLRGGASSCKYTTSVTKTKAADYGHIKWIKDLVHRTMWSQELVSYNKYALWGISHWGRKRQQFYEFAINGESARDVYSKRRIIAVTKLQTVKWHNYKHLDWITVRRDDYKLYKFKEGNFKRLCIQDIKDILLLLVQEKIINLTVEERFAFKVSLRMFTRSINKDKQNRLMQIDELHKFNDGMLNDVRTALDDRLKGIRMKYLPQAIWRRSDKEREAAMIQAIDK
uniref:Uncharacterized protein n=1 Tax=Tanacetum cinerariifolium TaxID=118510 RepID=A0A699GHP6_TANCI|nr:hypothetical protein [Tanacetum cinerariifolium]